MRKPISVIAFILCLCLCAFASAQDAPTGWYSDGEGEAYYFGADGSMQIWSIGERPATLQGDYLFAVTAEDGAYTLAPFTSPEYYVIRLSEDKSGMDMTDRQGNTTSWVNATPEEPVNASLKRNADNPLVGIWTQMTDDLTAPALELYDDGYYGTEDLFGLEDTGTEFGMYSCELGLLTLFTEDTGLTLTLKADGDGYVLDGEKKLSPLDPAGIFPTEESLAGTWTNEVGTYTYESDGSITGQGFSGGAWSLAGGRIMTHQEEPYWTLPCYASYTDGSESVMVQICDVNNDGELISATITRK